MKIANLTQHTGTPEQGVIEPEGDWKRQIRELLTFDEIPTNEEILQVAAKVAYYAKWMECDAAMIGGAPYLMAPLEAALRFLGVTPLYAFSQRESVEQADEKGNVKKVAVFKHAGFVEAVTEIGYGRREAVK